MINCRKNFNGISFVILLFSLVIFLLVSFCFLDNIFYMLFSQHSIIFKHLLIDAEIDFPWFFSEQSLELVIVICFLLLLFHFLIVSAYCNIYKFIFISISFFCLVAIKNYSKYVFGRCVPRVCSKYDLISASEQFHWFAGGGYFGSFPSGHCLLLSFLMIWLYFTYPKYKILIINFLGFVVVLLVISGYHFLSDCLAGLLVGIIYGIMTYFIWLYIEQIIREKIHK